MVVRHISVLFVTGFVFLVNAHDHRIDRYFKKVDELHIYHRFLCQVPQPKPVELHASSWHDNAMIATKTVSDVVCQCIHLSGASQLPDHAFGPDSISGIIVAVYTVLKGCMEILEHKQARSRTILQMPYAEIVTQYPHIVLLQHQIKIMELLIDMVYQGTFCEKVFGLIHLVSVTLPGRYEKYTRKQAKKLFKSCFNSQGALTSLGYWHKKQPYHAFYRKVPRDMHQLVLDNAEYRYVPASLGRSMYADLVANDYNQKLLAIIDAGMHDDLESVVLWCDDQNDQIIVNLRAAFRARIEA